MRYLAVLHGVPPACCQVAQYNCCILSSAYPQPRYHDTHSIHVAILLHTFCIPSAVKERSWRANGSSHFGAPAYFLKRHSLPEFGLRGEMIISSKQNTSFDHHDQHKCLSRKIKSLRIWRCQNTIMPTASDPIEVVILNSHDWQTVHVSTVSITEINLSTLFVVVSGHNFLEQSSHS